MPSTAGELFVDLEALDGVQRELTVLINALNELGVRPARMQLDGIGARG